MMLRFLGPLSLKARFLLGTSIMLTPLIFLAAGSFLALEHATHQMEEVVEESLEEDLPIVQLQKQIQRANMEGHDLLMSGTLIAREEFRAADRDVSRDFEAVINVAPFEMDEEHRYLQKAYDVWKASARELLEAHAGNAGASVSGEAYRLMEKFDAGMEQTLFHLDRVRSVAREEMDQQASLAYGARTRMLAVVVGVFVFAFAIAVGGALILARSVLLPVFDVATGLSRLTVGDYAHRVLVSTDDELGELARAFNRLGERLLQSDCAAERAMRDALTGMYTGRELSELLASEIQRSRRYHRPFSLALLDVDGFGNFNASYGREAGDEALRSIADVIRGEVRGVDRVARYGHDEFAILLTEVKSGGARVTVERVLSVVRELSLTVAGGQSRSLTLSAGIVEYGKEHASVDAMLLAAGNAVRNARLQGGDRVGVGPDKE